MDARSLGLREDLRIWYNDGLRFVFCDQDVDQTRATAQPVARTGAQTGAMCASSQGTAGSTTAGAKPAAAMPGPAGAAGSGTAASPQSRPVQPSRSATTPQHGSPAAQAPAAPAPPSPEPVQPHAGGTLSVFPWDEFRPKLVTPSRTVWTYWELGQDFGPNPDDARRELFKTIIKHLNWPGGSIAFWPLSFESGGALIANKGSFLRGVRETGAGTVICFGQKAFKTLFPRERYGLGRHSLPGLTVIALQGPGAMLGGDAQAKRQVWDTLRSLRF